MNYLGDARKKPMKKLYYEEYAKTRPYEFDAKYRVFSIIGKALVKKFKPKRVLDVGCAKGYLVYVFQEFGVEAYGVDISQHAISHSPESIRDRLQCCDVELEKLPFESESFDMITSFDTMEHLQNPGHAISEIARVLKPRGTVAIVVPKKTIPLIFTRLAFGRHAAHPSELSKSSWIRIFESHGFYYLEDFLKHEPKEVKHALHTTVQKAAYRTPPDFTVAQYLCNLAQFGKWTRVKLSLIFWQSEYLSFRWQGTQ